MAVAATACGTSTQIVRDDLQRPETIAAVELGTVRFDMAKWSLDREDRRQQAQEHEQPWTLALSAAFAAAATDNELAGGTPRQRVDVTVVDLDPGSRSARWWLGFGSGRGRAKAVVDVTDHGSFEIDGKIDGGAWGGDFADLMQELGEAIAEHIGERRDNARQASEAAASSSK